jgi:hypothetical protein
MNSRVTKCKRAFNVGPTILAPGLYEVLLKKESAQGQSCSNGEMIVAVSFKAHPTVDPGGSFREIGHQEI